MAINRLFHGVKGDKLLQMLPNDNDSKEITIYPDQSNEIYFDYTDLRVCFAHGADTKRRKSFVITVYIDLEELQYIKTSRPGNPTTLIVTSTTPIKGKIVNMHVRSGHADKGFKINIISEVSLIKAELQAVSE